MKHLSVALIVCAGLGLHPQNAHASPCADQIAQLETALQEAAARHEAPLTAPESLDAKLHHQPTPASVSQARAAARSRVDGLLAQAMDLDAKGDSAGCMRIVGDAKSIVDVQ